MSNQNSSYDKWKAKKPFNKNHAKKRNFKKISKHNVEPAVSQNWELDNDQINKFEEYPFSSKTSYGLLKNDYVKPTAIQKASLPSSIKGKDVLGAAKTGSGKTLAFIIPVLECLHRHHWNKMDGPGALIISPTRELAFQIFDVLQKVGCKHSFSAGLIIGGTDVSAEAKRLQKTNIVVCTPGRLLQHLDETSYFTLDNVKILVLDEADKILDMGFLSTINAVLENVPKERQTLLFSATQTQSIKDLARLSLQNPVFVSVHSESLHSTPIGLKQRYITCQLSEKFNILYSFVRNHIKSKTLVFMSSCKQVQYFFMVLCRLRPGIPVMHFHGKMNQQRRISVYQEFCRKTFALLLSTDVAARGLDFPHIDWVVQYDCPEDANTYIHRVGRTARYHGNGNALMLLNPCEIAIVNDLKKFKVPIVESELNTKKVTNLENRLQSYCAEDNELKEKAKRCFVTYLRSVHLMKNKSVFSVEKLPLEEYASSLGLACPPRVNFLRHKQKQKQQPQDEDTESVAIKDVWSQDTEVDNESLFTVKPDERVVKDEEIIFESPNVTAERSKKSKAAAAKQLLRKGMKVNTKIVFSEEGEVEKHIPSALDSTDERESIASDDENPEGGINVERTKFEMTERDKEDRLRHALNIRKKHTSTRKKAKEERRQQQQNKERGAKNFDEVALIDEGEDEVNFSEGEFDESDESLSDPPPTKRIKKENTNSPPDSLPAPDWSLAEEEDLVLHLLSRRATS